ncbi:WbqC family protein [Candidatus Bathycorpusculum sp.]|uniref:WbqC family protein n=1 Tax=Candidatus Bathycorpusculum sp. TaxID=2994959 RepID=UPI00283249CE|nr:WbqC family protein [Candidatus Termitimicrobium sp.]MCL2685634.1 WbqC family protein [Candidatus Termitimicrobium sp.]
MIAAGHQPNYLPWLGFFDKMQQADLFIIEDNIQFERQGFISRNKIMTAQGVRWLSVPIEHTNNPLLIKDAKIANQSKPRWRHKHWATLKHSYCKSPYWVDFADFFEETYQQEWTYLMDLNMHLIRGIMGFLNIDKPLVLGSSLCAEGKKTELLVNQCKQVGANIQLAGKGSKDYINQTLFTKQGIELIFQEFTPPKYSQTTTEGFVDNLSVVDYLFCTGGKPW